MLVPPLPENEAGRLEALRGYRILDSGPESGFDQIAGLARQILRTPMAMVSLVDRDRLWFKAESGSCLSQTPRDVAFCAHAILSDQVLMVPDARMDPRFRENPLVLGPPGMRFYAGAPLIDREGWRLGTLCVMDVEPREALSAAEEESLRGLARLVVTLIETRLADRRWQSDIDPLTGLPNRTALFHAFARHFDAEDGRREAALALIDLDHFRDVNDTLGHRAGDALLVSVAQRLISAAPEDGTVFRSGGDGFSVFLPGCGDLKHAADAVNTMLTTLAEPFDITGEAIHLGASAGIAAAPQHGNSAQDLIAHADLALLQAKSRGSGHVHVFEAHLHDSATARRTLYGELRRALADNEFVLHYQPQIDLATGTVIGAEALLRWNHPERGMLSPARFIAAIEASPLAKEVGDWILDLACAEAASWRARLDGPFRMAVNLFGEQLRHPTFVLDVETCLDRHGLPGEALELEITETVALWGDDAVLAAISHLKRRGIRWSFDDFGTGYASLSVLRRFPIDRLKIDRSFVRDALSDAGSAAIVRSVVMIAANLGLDVIAEGVETWAQSIFLKSERCQEAQGYLYGKPMCAAEFTALLPLRKVAVGQ